MGKYNKWLLSLIFASLLVFASFASVVRANDEVPVDEEEDAELVAEVVESDISQVVPVDDDEPAVVGLGPAEGVETVYVFPKYAGKAPVIPAGELTDVIVGIKNGHPGAINLLGIRARLHYSIDWSVVFQNFTVLELNGSMPAGVSASFAYSFTPDKLLAPREFGLSAAVYYKVGEQPFLSTFFNSTIEIIEPRGTISGESVFLAFLGTGLLGLLSFWAYSQILKYSKKGRRSKKVETGTVDADVSSNEWLQGTSLTQKQPKYVAQPRRAKR